MFETYSSVYDRLEEIRAGEEPLSTPEYLALKRKVITSDMMNTQMEELLQMLELAHDPLDEFFDTEEF